MAESLKNIGTDANLTDESDAVGKAFRAKKGVEVILNYGWADEQGQQKTGQTTGVVWICRRRMHGILACTPQTRNENKGRTTTFPSHPASPRDFGPFATSTSRKFFFQAEDGIRNWSVTGVQTCALPI